MPKLLPTGRISDIWKRLPSGVFVPGTRLLPTGRDLTAAQTLIQQVYLAANQKPFLWAIVQDISATPGATPGFSIRSRDYSGNQSDFVALGPTTEPVIVVDSTLGGRKYIQSSGARNQVNPIDLPSPSVQKLYRKFVNRLDDWPPGSRQWGGASTNRGGVITRSTPDTITLDNGVVGGSVDQPQGRWGVMTSRLGNSVADFLRWGATANTATGINCGNGNLSPGMGKLSNNTGTTGVTGSEAIDFAWSVDLTPAEDQAVEDLIVAFCGSANLLYYASVGNIKLAIVTFAGSSQTVANHVAGFQGMREDFYNNFGSPTGLNYPTYATGLTSAGSWPQPEHCGISGQGIDIDSGGPNPGSGLAVINTYLVPGGAAPIPGAGEIDAATYEYGGADILGGTYTPGGVGVPGSSAYNMLQMLITGRNANPNLLWGVNAILPQQGDPATIPAFNAEILGVGGVCDAYDALYPTTPCARIDGFTALGGAWSALYFVDNVHLNLAGQNVWGGVTNAAMAAGMNARTTY